MSTGLEQVPSTEAASQHRKSSTGSGESHSSTTQEDSGSTDIQSQETIKQRSRSISRTSASAEEKDEQTINAEEVPPPLPPRPINLNLLGERNSSVGSSLQVPKRSIRPQLQSQATIAVSRTDIHTQSYPDGSRETYAGSNHSTPSRKSSRHGGSFRRSKGQGGSEVDDSASVMSYAPTIGTSADAESLLGDVLGVGQQSPAWRLLSSQTEKADPFSFLPFVDEEPTADFSREFDELGELDEQGDNEG